MRVWQALWQTMAPELWLTLIGFGIFTVDLLFPRLGKRHYGTLALIGFIGALGWLGWQLANVLPFGAEAPTYTGAAYWLTTTFAADPLAMFFKVTILIGAILVGLVTMDYVEKQVPSARAEFYGLMVFAVLALCFMASAAELITLFLAIEFASISSYILVGYLRDEPKSAEGGMKYFLVGATTTAASLYGMSLIYGTTGTTHLYEIAKGLSPSLGEKGAAFAKKLPLVVYRFGQNTLMTLTNKLNFVCLEFGSPKRR